MYVVVAIIWFIVGMLVGWKARSNEVKRLQDRLERLTTIEVVSLTGFDSTE